MEVKEKPEVCFQGVDGNVFALMGVTRRALIEAGQRVEAEEMQDRVVGADSYDHALRIMLEYVEPTFIDEDEDWDDYWSEFDAERDTD